MDRLKALAVFKAVVDQGSFARAADALDLSPAVVTRTVQELEALLTVRLLQRTTRRIALTPVGQEVLERARDLLASFDALSSMSSLCGSEPAGKVRLSAPAWLGRGFLGEVAARYLASCPKVSLELRMHAGEGDALAGDADLALCLQADLKPSSIARKVAQVNVGLYASPVYLRRKGEPGHPDELTQHECLASGPGRADAVWRFQQVLGTHARAIEIKSILNANQPETLMSAAIHGAGLALLPDLLTEEAVANGTLRRLLPGWSAEPLCLHLAYESRAHQPLSVRKLIEVISTAFEGMMDCGTEQLVPVLPASLTPLGEVMHRQVPVGLARGVLEEGCLLAA